LPEDATDRGPKPAEQPLTVEVLAVLVALVAEPAASRGWRDDRRQLEWTGGTIHSAFHAYQYACEERRQRAIEVGDVAQRLTEVLCAVGWRAADVRTVDVHELARVGVRRAWRRRRVRVVQRIMARANHLMSRDLSQLSERQLYALRKRLAAGLHDPALSRRGAVHSDLRQCSKVGCRCLAGRAARPLDVSEAYL